MSVVDSLIQPPVIPERRRRESPDIIDIDALDADDVVYVGSTRSSQRRRVGEDGRGLPVIREVIHITDSEDDNEIEFIGRNPARPQTPFVGRHRIFSPPPPPQIDGIPPVPQIPERFLPLRQRQPPGLVIPDEDPLPFEANLQPPPPAEQPRPVAAAPSHHVPSMGFGGALLAGVRRIIAPSNPSQRHERQNSWGVAGSFVMRWNPFDFADGEEDDLLDALDVAGFLGEGDNVFAARRVRSQIERAFKQREQGGRAEPDYKPEYTHPDRPLPGFTHDFSHSCSPRSGTDDNTALRLASGSGTQCEVSIVCAACRDPLVVGASDVGDDRAKRKLWGLRCGHLLDGKCVQKLMEPNSPTPGTNGSNSTRNVTELEQYRPPSQDTFASSSRTRSRPRRGMPVPLTSTAHGASGPFSRGRHGGYTHRSNHKGKGKMKAPVVEAEHEWSCPVGGCERVHLSLLMDGRWLMDEKRGAIAVFV